MTVFPDDVPVLTDGLVTVRAHRESDLPRIVEFANDPRSRAGVPLPSPYGIEQAREFFAHVREQWESTQAPRNGVWAIEVDGRWAGSINLHGRAPGTVELGYGAHPDVRGHGVVTAAARLIAAHAFDDLHLQTLVWRAARGNWASRRVAWALGFTVDGTWPATHPTGDGHVTGTWLGHLHSTDPRTPQLPWREPAVLAGGGIRLRPWTEADAPDEQLDPPLSRFMLGTAPSAERFGEWLLRRRERMAGGEAVVWCIADAETDRALGGIQLFRMDLPTLAGTAMLAYWLQPSARGRGHLSQALELVVAHAFSPASDGGLGLRRIGANVDVENLPSQRVLRAGGFRAIGRAAGLPSYDDGSVSDETEFELLATDDRESQRRIAIPAPVLRTERLVLRAWGEGDAPDDEPMPDAQAAAAMGIEPRPPAAAYARWLAEDRLDDLKGTAVGWCIADRETGRPLGSIGIRDLGTPLRSGTVGYWLYDVARGQGFGKEALRAVVDHAFAADGLALHRLAAATVDGNHSSMLTLASAGFRQYGQDHGSFVAADGTITDTAYFELLADEHRGREIP